MVGMSMPALRVSIGHNPQVWTLFTVVRASCRSVGLYSARSLWVCRSFTRPLPVRLSSLFTSTLDLPLVINKQPTSLGSYCLWGLDLALHKLQPKLGCNSNHRRGGEADEWL
ncbi:uncharacterized protein YALI1_D06442g [Yarrowia lipolytica]|uniref:Uncharacterized protein n=1 Tax=Yarrowia lipolytica TaxID=4952 RepID=A0A1D8ND88_YARLL|nr:hypothetical protein YALI1_D06442g [Yarrowia lipolytica]